MFNDSLSVRVSDYAAVLDRLKGSMTPCCCWAAVKGRLLLNTLRWHHRRLTQWWLLMADGAFLDDVTDSFRNSPQPLEESQLAGFLAFTDAVKRNEVENDMLVSQHGMRWWREFLAADAQQVLNGQTKPVLVIQTLNDTNVSVTSFKQMQKAVENPW